MNQQFEFRIETVYTDPSRWEASAIIEHRVVQAATAEAAMAIVRSYIYCPACIIVYGPDRAEGTVYFFNDSGDCWQIDSVRPGYWTPVKQLPILTERA